PVVAFGGVGARENHPSLGSEVFVHPGRPLEVAVLLLGDDAPAVARDVLAADDRPVLGDPPAATLILARAAVPGLGGHLPAGKRLAVEDLLEAGLVELLGLGRLGPGEPGG